MKKLFSKNGLKFGILVLLLMVSFSLIGCGGSSSKSSPEPVGVTFYKDAGYTGTSVTYGVGKYNGDQLAKDGMYHSISSMKIPNGFVVIAYFNNELSQTSRTFYNNVPDMSPEGWDDSIGSMEVKLISQQ